MDCSIDIPDNRVVSFIVGFVACLIVIFVGWITVHMASDS